MVGGAGARRVGPALCRGRHVGHRRATARGKRCRCRCRRRLRADRRDDARSHHAAGDARRPGRPRLRGLCDRGVVDRHRRAPPRRHAGAGCRLHQFHAGPPRLPRRHGRLLAGQGTALRLARPARRRRQSRRRTGRRARGSAGRNARRSLDGVDARRRATAGNEYPPRPRRPVVRGARRRHGRAGRDTNDRRLQRRQPAGGARRPARARSVVRRCGGSLRDGDAGAGPHATGCAARRRSRCRCAGSRRRLRAHARCARQGALGSAAARCRTWRPALVRVRLRR